MLNEDDIALNRATECACWHEPDPAAMRPSISRFHWFDKSSASWVFAAPIPILLFNSRLDQLVNGRALGWVDTTGFQRKIHDLLADNFFVQVAQWRLNPRVAGQRGQAGTRGGDNGRVRQATFDSRLERSIRNAPPTR